MANSVALPNVTSVPPSVTKSRSSLAPVSPMPPAYCPGTVPGAHPVHDLARAHLGDHDHVELLAQVAGLHVGVVQHA